MYIAITRKQPPSDNHWYASIDTPKDQYLHTISLASGNRIPCHGTTKEIVSLMWSACCSLDENRSPSDNAFDVKSFSEVRSFPEIYVRWIWNSILRTSSWMLRYFCAIPQARSLLISFIKNHSAWRSFAQHKSHHLKFANEPIKHKRYVNNIPTVYTIVLSV